VTLPVSAAATRYRRCRSSMALLCLLGMHPAYKVLFKLVVNL
jgi:hypothetical protein